MRIIEVPVFNEDGSVRLVQEMNPEEAQHILQFAMNFLIANGLAVNYAVQGVEETEEEEDSQGELFEKSKLN